MTYVERHREMPAFPNPELQNDAYEPHSYEWGLKMRDWFAGQAIRAMWGNGTAMTAEEAAQMAYQLADAMMHERERGEP